MPTPPGSGSDMGLSHSSLPSRGIVAGEVASRPGAQSAIVSLRTPGRSGTDIGLSKRRAPSGRNGSAATSARATGIDSSACIQKYACSAGEICSADAGSPHPEQWIDTAHRGRVADRWSEKQTIGLRCYRAQAEDGQFQLSLTERAARRSLRFRDASSALELWDGIDQE